MGNVYMEASQINYRGGEKKMSVEEALKNTSGEAAAIAQLQSDVADLNDVKANQITIAPSFSAETAYDPGDLVYYNGLTYRCVNAHEGEWDADDFAATTVANELASLMSGLTNVDVALSVPDGSGKNVLPYPFSDTTKTVNGVTFTDNGDGTISTSGQSTARTVFYIQNNNANLHIPAGIYTVSKSHQNTYTVLNVDGYNGNTWVKSLAKSSSTDDVTFTVDYNGYDRISIYLEIQTNIVTDNIIFKPMIRPATITDATYAPYIPSVESRLESVESGKANVATYNMVGGQTVNITHVGIVAIMSDRGGLYTDGIANRGVNDLVSSTQITVTNVDSNNVTVANNSQYGTSILVLSDGDITITSVQ